ncbi:Collagen triple helix repeat (20 copies) [Popillia japonica]|uniref:Collagen triple helix repeat (20 copies) n=1 Tax=Popillia japonica TaxID=7064 RepID=A0AAW1JHX4_POPJA
MKSKSETFFYTVTITIVTQLLCGVFVYHFVEDNRKVNHSNVMPREKFDEYLLTSLKVGRWRRELDAAMQSSLGLERHKRDEETSESPELKCPDGFPGPKGDIGDAGFPGHRGPYGMAGLRGPEGEPGLMGLPGPLGFGRVGVPGIKGERGNRGEKGESASHCAIDKGQEHNKKGEEPRIIDY